MSGILPIIVLVFVILVLVAALLYAIFGTRSLVVNMAGASLVGLAPLVPMVAVIVAVLTYLLQLDPIAGGDNSAGRFAVLLGSAAALTGWLLFAGPYLRFALPSRANPRSFQELQYRLEQVDAHLQYARKRIEQNHSPANADTKRNSSAKAAHVSTGNDGGGVAESGRLNVEHGAPGDEKEIENSVGYAAYSEAMSHRNYVAQELGYDINTQILTVDPKRIIQLDPGARWIDATGYLNLWARLHRAEEALIEIDSLEEVIARGVYDELRIQGSNLDNSDRLLAKLRKAVFVLSNPGAQIPASDYLSEQPPAIPNPNPNADGSPDRVIEARSVLRQVRRALNEFRDSKWEGLVMARNRLRETVTITWLVTFLLVTVIILASVPAGAVMAGAVFFLVGALVGLFDLLRIANSEKVTLDEDYGFARTQMLQAPLLSGLAAVVGVVLFALVPGIFNKEAAQPSRPTATPTTAEATVVTPTLTITTTLTLTPQPTNAPTQTPITGTTGVLLSAMLLESAAQVTATPELSSSTPITATPTMTTTPTAATASSSALTPNPNNSLDDIFNIQRNTFGLIIAAIFGLTPGLLTSSLRQKVQGYIGDLNSTEAQDGGSK